MNAKDKNHRRLFLLPLTSVCAMCAGLGNPALGQGQPGTGGNNNVIDVTEYDVVDLAVQDADLAQVLQMLSLQSRKNIISSKNVSATVTANLYDVTFAEALDAILKVNGYVWREEGNFIYVYTKEEWDTLEKQSRRMVSRIFDLNYISAPDAEDFVTPLLSADGKLSAVGDVESGFKPGENEGGADSYAYNVRLVVNDFPENLDEISQLLDELDTPPDQVLVEATILQATVDERNAFGVDFTILGDMDFTDIVSPLSAVNALIGDDEEIRFQPPDNRAQAGTQSVGGTAGPAGLKIGIVRNDVSVFLRVLDEVTDSTVLARPKVMALNRQRAEVLVGARVGYLSTTATETTTTQTVEFLDTGVQLVFRPFISKDGTIRMELKPSVSEASLRTVTDSNNSLVTIPDELTNELTTNVRVRDGQTLVLGGLFREANQVTRRQVPLLGDVPILGAAFRGQDDSVQRSEIIFLITPTITHDQTLWQYGDEMLAMTELARIGSRNGLLPFSQTKMTAAHNINALRAAEGGDTDLAIWHADNSLHLQPDQPEMIRLRQQWSGERARNFERSVLQRVLHRSEQTMGGAGDQSNAAPTTGFDRDPLASINRLSVRNRLSNEGARAPSQFDNEFGAGANRSGQGFNQNSNTNNFGGTSNPPSNWNQNDFNNEDNFNNQWNDEMNGQFEDGFSGTKPGTTGNARPGTTSGNASQPVKSGKSQPGFTHVDPQVDFWNVKRSAPAGSWWFTPQFMPHVSETGQPQVDVMESGHLRIFAEDADIEDVLTALYVKTGREIVADPEVRGTVSADLSQVSFFEALDAILHTHDMDWEEIGNVIYVYADDYEDATGFNRFSDDQDVAEVDPDDNQ